MTECKMDHPIQAIKVKPIHCKQLFQRTESETEKWYQDQVRELIYMQYQILK